MLLCMNIPTLIAFAVLSIAGCGSNKTETGYEPKRLGMNGPQIRSLYAPAFSPDARPVDAPSNNTPLTRRPGT